MATMEEMFRNFLAAERRRRRRERQAAAAQQPSQQYFDWWPDAPSRPALPAPQPQRALPDSSSQPQPLADRGSPIMQQVTIQPTWWQNIASVGMGLADLASAAWSKWGPAKEGTVDAGVDGGRPLALPEPGIEEGRWTID